MFSKNKKLLLPFLLILLLAYFFRFYNVNWDDNHHLHPDERFLTMVAGAMKWPQNIGEYLDTSNSKLNPHNIGFGFYVYGTFPVIFTRWVAESLGKNDYNNLTLIGRQLSAGVDLLTVVLVFLIARNINPKFKAQRSNQVQSSKIKKTKQCLFGFGILEFICNLDFGIWLFPLISMFLYAIMVLPIQLSHFFAVDTYLTFFITLSFYLLIKLINCKFIGNWKLEIGNYAILLGIAFGLAVACKITALLFLPIIGLGLLFKLIKDKNLFSFIVICSLLSVICYFTVRLALPYLFAHPNLLDATLNVKVLENWKQMKALGNSESSFPPAIQWIRTKPYLFPLKNTFFWGLGLPIGILFIIGITFQIISILITMISEGKKSINNDYIIVFLMLVFWIFMVFGYEGRQFAKAMRYIYPIYPAIAVITAIFISKFTPRKSYPVHILFILILLIYPLSFMSLYSQDHSRVSASKWIYQNIPKGSTISVEHWDDGLPISLPIPGFIHEQYKYEEYPLYGFDNKEKWDLMNQKLARTDYIILTSNRLYGAIMTVPDRYPITYRYYTALFDGSLDFQKVAEFTSRPNLPIPGIKMCMTPPFVRYGIIALKSQECPLTGTSFVDDYADETFTVYDHPKVLIFKKMNNINYFHLLSTPLQ